MIQHGHGIPMCSGPVANEISGKATLSAVQMLWQLRIDGFRSSFHSCINYISKAGSRYSEELKNRKLRSHDHLPQARKDSTAAPLLGVE